MEHACATVSHTNWQSLIVHGWLAERNNTDSSMLCRATNYLHVPTTLVTCVQQKLSPEVSEIHPSWASLIWVACGSRHEINHCCIQGVLRGYQFPNHRDSLVSQNPYLYRISSIRGRGCYSRVAFVLLGSQQIATTAEIGTCWQYS